MHWSIVDLAVPLAENLERGCMNCRSCFLSVLSNLADPLTHTLAACVALQVGGCIL